MRATKKRFMDTYTLFDGTLLAQATAKDLERSARAREKLAQEASAQAKFEGEILKQMARKRKAK